MDMFFIEYAEYFFFKYRGAALKDFYGIDAAASIPEYDEMDAITRLLPRYLDLREDWLLYRIGQEGIEEALKIHIAQKDRLRFILEIKPELIEDEEKFKQIQLTFAEELSTIRACQQRENLELEGVTNIPLA